MIKYSFKSLFVIAVLALGFFAVGIETAGANGGDDHTIQEEAAGMEVWEKFRQQQIVCADLTEEDFEQLGEYFMGQMMGEAHAAMNQMMIQIHGEEGEEQIHAAMGKRLSGCDPRATFSGGELGWMPMMQMMQLGWSLADTEGGSNLFTKNNNPMMGGYNMMGWGGSWPITITWFIWTLVGLLAAVWLWQQIAKK